MTSVSITPDTLETIDWTQLRAMDALTASGRLTSILQEWDGVEKRAYAVRGMAMLLIEERELWRHHLDREVGVFYVSFDKWLKDTCPESWSYCRQALATVKELKEMPFEDLLQIKRCNLEQLKKVSSGVRLLPAVVRAAKANTEKEFVARLNADHQQHLEVRHPVIMADAAVSTKIDEACAMAELLYGCKSRGEQLECIAQDFVETHSTEYEHMKDGTA